MNSKILQPSTSLKKVNHDFLVLFLLVAKTYYKIFFLPFPNEAVAGTLFICVDTTCRSLGTIPTNKTH